jgi:LPPG:FO 2-phospho-L-lactate transferase
VDGSVLALAGGTGGAKLVLGLARWLPPQQLAIVVNTGDDELFHGLHVSPDLDTIMYTLAGLVNQETGWGLAGDTFNSLEMLRRYDVDTWFNLGDRDLATHIRRTQLLGRGHTLSQVTEELCRQLGVEHKILPMSDQPVRTVLSTDIGDLPMQSYFVRQRCEPRVRDIVYVGAESAEAAPQFAAAMARAGMVLFCPSNPYLSVGPILAVPRIRRQIAEMRPPQLRVAVSPIVGGAAVRGPAAKIMAELGHEVSCVGVAQSYQDICDVLVIDQQDAHLAPEIQRMGLKPLVAPIIMNTEADKIALARRILQLTGNYT